MITKNFKMNLKTLQSYKEAGWLMNQVHPDVPLTIWNYTQQTQYEGFWDEVTLSCRGLVTDEFGNIVARPFKKFFNMEEGKHTPTSEYELFDKMDGSLGISFNYKKEWYFASRGSFTSDQCERGADILNDDLNRRCAQPLIAGFTYLFEIIYPENRIVVDYGDMEDVVMLGAINTETGEEMAYNDMVNKHGFGWSIVKKYDGISDFGTLKKIIGNNQEGFVVRFSNGDRMKIKGEEYLRLHKIMTEISTKTVWETLSEGRNIEDILVNVPDEFFAKIKAEVLKQNSEFEYRKVEAMNHYSKYMATLDGEHSMKNFALWNAANTPKEYVPILFSMANGKDWKRGIWNLVKPDYKKL